MQNLRNIIFGILLIFTSCGKQESPEFEETIRSKSELERREACNKVNFTKKLTYRDNLISMFRCLKWNVEFKAMYSSLKMIPEENWNHLFAPLNELFFDNIKRRDRVFGYIKELDKKQGLDDLSKVLLTLNNYNIFNAYRDLFLCANDQSESACKDRDFLSKSEIKKLLKIIDIEKDTLVILHNFLSNFLHSYKKVSKDIKPELRRILNNRKFELIRSEVLKVLLSELSQGDKEKFEKVFHMIVSMLRQKDSNGDPWLYTWINNQHMNKNVFKKMLQFFSADKSNFVKNHKVYKNLNKTGIRCGGENASNLKINLKNYEKEFLSQLMNAQRSEFFINSLDETILFSMAKETCPEISKISSEIPVYSITMKDIRKTVEKYELDLSQCNEDYIKLFSIPGTFNLVKYSLHNLKSHSDFKNEDLLLMIDISSSDMMNLLSEALSIVELNENSKLYDGVFDILKDMPKESFEQMSSLLLRVKDEVEISTELRKLWSFFNFKERNFIFEFFDEHFKEDVRTELLFDFYLKILAEVSEIVDEIPMRYIKNDFYIDRTYESLGHLSKHLSGEDLREDFYRFFSADHIIKIIKIISRSMVLETSKIALGAVNVDEYLKDIDSTAIKLPVKFEHVTDDTLENRYINCYKALVSDDENFYSLLSSFPEECGNIDTDTHVILDIVKNLSEVNHDYKPLRYIDIEEDEDLTGNGMLFDRNGIISPPMLNSSLQLSYLSHEYFKEKGGLSYLIETVKEFINQSFASEDIEFKVSDKLDDLILGFKSLIDINSYDQQEIRNSLLKDFFKKDDYKLLLRDSLIALAKILKDYSEYVPFINESDILPEDPVFSCVNTLNQEIGENVCPKPDYIVKSINNVLRLLNREHDDVPTARDILVEALLPNAKVKIPYDPQNFQRDWIDRSRENGFYQLTFKETLEMMFKMTYRDFIVESGPHKGEYPNQEEVEYLQFDPTNPKGKKIKLILTNAERVESLIRDVAFKGNYLGAHYMNSVARGSDYNKVVLDKYKLFSLCVKARFCLKTFTKDELRNGNNAVINFPSLLYANTKFGHADYMHALLQIVVGSSSKIAQRDKLMGLPYIQTIEQLKEHNGLILTNLSNLSLFSNGGRVLQDRIGRSGPTNDPYENFKIYLESDEFNLIHNAFLRGFDVRETMNYVEKIIHNLLNVKDKSNKSLQYKVVNWLYNSTYREIRTLEQTLANILAIAYYLAPPKTIIKNYNEFTTNLDSSSRKKLELYNSTFSKNSFFDLLPLFELITRHFDKLDQYLPHEIKVHDIVKPLHSLTRFIKTKLIENKETSLLENNYYLVLNTVFKVIRSLLYEADEGRQSGLAFLSDAISSGKYTQNFERIAGALRSGYHLMDTLHFDSINQLNGKKFKSISEFSLYLLENTNLSFAALSNYIEFTTYPSICFGSPEICQPNYHYDEPASLAYYLSQAPEGEKKSRVKKLLDYVFGDNDERFKKLIKIINKFIPALQY